MCFGPDCKTVRNPGRDSSLGSYIASGMFVSSSCQTVPVGLYLGAMGALLKTVRQLFGTICQFFQSGNRLLVHRVGFGRCAGFGRCGIGGLCAV
jgi:hypothetical protein